MEENRNQQGRNEQSADMSKNTGNQQQQHTGAGTGANPQDGDQWNNYRSRELSDNGGQGEQNRSADRSGNKA